MTVSPHLVRYATPEALAAAAAEHILERFAARQAEGEVPVLVLTGGSMGVATLAGLADHPNLDRVDWRRVRFLWGDERWLPAGDPERNDRIADETLFATVGTDPSLVHRVASSDSGITLEEAAEQYSELIDGLARIDIALFGVGPDGHLASLFPGRDDLLKEGEEVRSALAVRNSPKPPPERVSFSLPAIRRAERVWLLAAGSSKQDAVARTLDGDARLPVTRVSGTVETLLWTDDAAASS